MSVRGIDHVNIAGPAELMVRCRDFYVDAIGLAEGFRPPFRRAGYWLYAGEWPVIHLTVSDRGADATGAFDHFALQCDGLEEMLARLQQHGVAHEITSVPGAAVTQLFVRDPAGVGVELSFRTRSSSR